MAGKKDAKEKTPVSKFRDELTKIMPGFGWTVHNESKISKYLREKDRNEYIRATGIQSSGFNRLSTLQVERRVKNDQTEYEVKSSGFGLKAPWLATVKDGTLARALRRLQEHYEHTASNYGSHANDLKIGRRTFEQLTAHRDSLHKQLEQIEAAINRTNSDKEATDAN